MRVRRRFGPAVAALTILGLLTSAPDADAAGKKSPMIVVLDRDADVDAAVKRGKRDHGLKPTNVFKHAARGYAAELTPGQARAIERDGSVMGVIPDSVVELVAQVTPPGVRRVRATSSPLTHINGVGPRLAPSQRGRGDHRHRHPARPPGSPCRRRLRLHSPRHEDRAFQVIALA